MRDPTRERTGDDATGCATRRIRPGFAILATLALLTGCREQKKGASPTRPAATGQIRDAAEQAIATDEAKGAAMPFRGVQVYDQAAPGRWAVCGQVAPFRDDPNIFVPFVSVVAAPRGGSPAHRVEQHVGTTTAEADHVYMALVTYCYEKGGPVSGPFQSVTPLPPLPDTVPDPSHGSGMAQRPAASASPASRPALATADVAGAPDQAPASGSVTMRQNANVHAAPHGASVRVVPQGTVMRIFATAPGGWYQVGDTAPWGWVHESMMDRH